MEEIECDVLVIGAGPSGSSAARSSAQENLDTIIIDEKEQPGKDACAETLSKALLQYLPFKIPEKFLKWELKGLRFYYDKTVITKDEGIWWKSNPLNRSEFDPYVLNLAKNEGATFLPFTKFMRLTYDQNYKVTEVIAENIKTNKIIKIRPKIVISAEGMEFSVLKSINKLNQQKTLIGHIKSYEYHDINLEDFTYGHVYFGDYADGAYAYVFPKSETTANIGIATLSDQNLDEKFETFLDVIKPIVKDSVKIVDRSGTAPIKYPSNKMSYGNILFTGDTANQNLKPFVEGIIPGIICGSIAGKTASKCISKISQIENEYQSMISNQIGELFEESDIITSILTSSFEKQTNHRFLLELGIFSYMLDPKDLLAYSKMSDNEAEKFLRKKFDLNS